MKRRILLIISISLLLIITYYAFSYALFIRKYGKQRIGSMDQTYTYISQDNDYSILIPNAWNVHKVKAQPEYLEYLLETISTSNPYAFINVSRVESNEASSTEILDYMQKYRNGLDQISEIMTDNVVYGENSGTLIEYTYLEHLVIGDYMNHCYDWIVAYNGGYDFTFCVEDDIWEYGKPIFLEMIKSIKLE